MNTPNNTANTQGRMFKEAFDSIPVKLKYEPEWCNHGGSFTPVCKAVHLDPGVMAKSYDDVGRRLILIGTRFGTVVVYDRYADQIDGGVYVTSRPYNKMIRALLTGKSVGAGEMSMLLGAYGNTSENIGFRIEDIAKEFNKEEF